MHHDDGEMEANMDGLCPVCGGEGCECVMKDRGMCPDCGEWNCEKHVSSLPGGLLEGIDPAHLELAKKYSGAMIELTDEELQDLKEGRELIYNTGLETKFKKLTKEQQDALAAAFKALDEERETSGDPDGDETEETEDGRGWVLPPPISICGPTKPKYQPPKIGMAGGTVLYSDYPEDTETGGKYKPWPWLTLLKQEHTVDSAGQPKTVTVLRPDKNASRFEAIAKVAEEIIPHLRRHLRLALEAEARVSRDRSLRRGKIDAGRAGRLVTDGRSDIFYKKSDAKSIKTAVQIVLDDSSSMRSTPGAVGISRVGKDAVGNNLLRSKNGTAMLLAIALGEVCNQLSIPFEILSYHSAAPWCPGYGDHYSILYKTFNEPWVGTKERLGNYRCDAGVDLPYEAANFAVNRLCSRTEPHRIMFFLSDGNDINRDVAKLVDLADEADEKAKIKIVGISILEDGIKRHMKHRAEHVTKLDDLTETVFLKLAKLIHPT